MEWRSIPLNNAVLDNADAVLVIDMQNGLLRPEGTMYQYRGRVLLDVDRTITRTAEVVAAATTRDLPVIYTRHCYRPGYPDADPNSAQLFKSMGTEPLLRGSWDATIVDELSPGPGAFVVDKTRFDAFQGSDLELLLRGIRANRLVVTGVVTNVCVETTTRAAAMRDIGVTVLSDCCTTFSAEHQANALEALEYYMFAQVQAWEGADVLT